MGGNIVSKYQYGNARPILGWTCSHCKTDYIHKLEEHEERSHAADIIEEEDYVEPMFYCAHCEYKTNDHLQLTTHMEISHTLADNTNEQEIADAIEVWKIYKLLQRMKNK